MNTPSKKFIYIVLLLVLIAGLAAWFLFFSSPEQKEGVKNIFPFFGQTQEDAGQQPSDGTGATPDDDIFSPSQGRQPLLYKLHNAPVAGIMSYGSGEIPYVRYIERGLGHVYETDLSTLTESQVSIETIPSVQDAVWSFGGSSVATRRSGDSDPTSIETYTLKLPSVGDIEGVGSVGTLFPQDIVGFASQENSIFYLVKTGSGVVGNVSSFDGTSRKQIFSSPFTEWTASWPTKNAILLATKPSSGALGHVYTLNPSTGALVREIANIPGVVASANSTMSTILYLRGESRGGGYTMHLFDTASKESSPFNFFTMPEKCVWSGTESAIVYCAIPDLVPPGTYPDDWYQGVVSFSDSLWRINTETGESSRIIGLVDQDGTPMDAVHLILDEQGATISFINKRDGLPWRMLLDQTAFGFTPATNDPLQPES